MLLGITYTASCMLGNCSSSETADDCPVDGQSGSGAKLKEDDLGRVFCVGDILSLVTSTFSLLAS